MVRESSLFKLVFKNKVFFLPSTWLIVVGVAYGLENNEHFLIVGCRVLYIVFTSDPAYCIIQNFHTFNDVLTFRLMREAC